MALNNQKMTIGIEGVLPQVLVDYLWEMVEQTSELVNHSFVLTIQTTGSGKLQEILHLSQEGAGVVESRKVFGFPPVYASVCVTQQDGCLIMKRTGLLEAVGQMGA